MMLVILSKINDGILKTMVEFDDIAREYAS